MNNRNKEFMSYLEDYKTKGVGIITDRQNVFEIEKDRKFIHDEKAMELTGIILQKSNDITYDSDFIYYFCDCLDFIVYIPEKITYNQYSHLIDIIKKIYYYNNKYLGVMKIHAVSENSLVKFDERTNLNIVLKQLEQIRKTQTFQKNGERIIGEVLDDEAIYENITFMSELDRANNTSNLEKSFVYLLNLYKDDFYKKYIDHLFPDFYLVKDINYFNWDDIKDSIDKKIKNVETYLDVFQIIEEGVKYSLEKNIEYYLEIARRYESFNDSRYQKEIIDARSKIENNRRIYNGLINKEKEIKQKEMFENDEQFLENGKTR